MNVIVFFQHKIHDILTPVLRSKLKHESKDYIYSPFSIRVSEKSKTPGNIRIIFDDVNIFELIP